MSRKSFVSTLPAFRVLFHPKLPLVSRNQNKWCELTFQTEWYVVIVSLQGITRLPLDYLLYVTSGLYSAPSSRTHCTFKRENTISTKFNKQRAFFIASNLFFESHIRLFCFLSGSWSRSFKIVFHCSFIHKVLLFRVCVNLNMLWSKRKVAHISIADKCNRNSRRVVWCRLGLWSILPSRIRTFTLAILLTNIYTTISLSLL